MGVRAVSCEVDLKEYPEIKTADEGDKFQVEGQIGKIHLDSFIHLSHVSSIRRVEVDRDDNK
jgi:hypothetical protein